MRFMNGDRLDLPSMPIEASMLKAVALLELVGQLHRGNFQQLLEQGFSPSLLDKVRTLELQDAYSLAEQADLNLSFQVDMNSLEACLTRLKQTREQRLLLEYFVQHQASPRMLLRLFKLSRKDVTTLRALLNVDVSAGRPVMPDIDDKLSIQRDWQYLCDVVADPRYRFRQLHERHPSYSLATLDAIVQEAEHIEVPLSRFTHGVAAPMAGRLSGPATSLSTSRNLTHEVIR